MQYHEVIIIIDTNGVNPFYTLEKCGTYILCLNTSHQEVDLRA